MRFTQDAYDKGFGMTNSTCAACGSDRLVEIGGLAALKKVTSDCKPFASKARLACCAVCGTVQKKVDPAWLGEIDTIYQDYELFALSSGAEQVIFAHPNEPPRSRSRHIIDFLLRRHSLGDSGRILDVGCGTGAALANFSKALPNWRLYGSELSDRASPRLRELPNFAELYTCDLPDIPGTFEIITFIHVLEHVINPVKTLSEAARLLAPNGVLVVQVPDLQTSCYDVLIADHRTHFTRATLGYAAASAGLVADTLINTLLPKEITLVARRGETELHCPDPEEGLTLARNSVAWLTDVRNAARRLPEGAPVGIFGTSISGMWCFAEIGDRVSFFVDEDETRVGGSFEGRQIYAPGDAPAGSRVFVPLTPPIAKQVVQRLSGLAAEFVEPPPFVAAPRP